MKILYVDYFQKDGHINFNRIHIDALRCAGHQVDLVFHSEVASHLPYGAEDYVLQLPRVLRFREGRPLLNRIVFCLTLLYILLRVRVSAYDKVFLGCIDEFSYNLLPLRRDCYIFAHGNGRFLPDAKGLPCPSPAKFRALKRLSKRATFVVFNDYMARPFREAGFPNVEIISHGCVPPFPTAPADAYSTLPFPINAEMRIVFHPSGKCNEDFLRQTLADSQLHAFLEETNTHIVFRNRPAWVNADELPLHIHFIDGFLPDKLYQALFLRADVILMCYPPSFHHQVSGVSFECVANQKLVLALQTEALDYLRSYFNYDPLFADSHEFTERLRHVVQPCSTAAAPCRIVVKPTDLTPDYIHFFEH